jgi:hypothetical protein
MTECEVTRRCTEIAGALFDSFVSPETATHAFLVFFEQCLADVLASHFQGGLKINLDVAPGAAYTLRLSVNCDNFRRDLIAAAHEFSC